jgi:hypothetical protein
VDVANHVSPGRAGDRHRRWNISIIVGVLLFVVTLILLTILIIYFPQIALELGYNVMGEWG